MFSSWVIAVMALRAAACRSRSIYLM